MNTFHPILCIAAPSLPLFRHIPANRCPGLSWIRDKMIPLLSDLFHAARALRKSPVLAVIAIASLALGIGPNVTIYSVVREMVFDDLSARQPGRLARIDAVTGYATYRDPRRAAVFEDPAFSIRRWILRNGFVAMQLALSMMLLIAGRCVLEELLAGRRRRSWIRRFTHRDRAGLFATRGASRRERLDLARWYRSPHERSAGVLGVTSIGTLPLKGELPQDPVRRKGDALASARDAYSVGAGERFCKVLGIPVLRGRDFEIADRSRQPVPVLVNQTLARRLFGDTDPIGSQLLVGRGHQQVLEIIGVTADSKMRTLGEDHAPVFFTPFTDAQLLVRVAGNPIQWIQPLSSALAEGDMSSAIDVRPLSDATAGAIFPLCVAAGFVGSLSGLALLLVLTGLYSSVSYATRGRTREMAIRAAVGSTRSMILWTAIRDRVAVLACGLALGLPLAIAIIRPLTGILPDGVNPWDPVIFSAVCLLLLATGAGAAYIPARFAANVDPSLVLRQE
jgi:hypothetical protein